MVEPNYVSHYTILTFGESGAGKTSFIYTLTENEKAKKNIVAGPDSGTTEFQAYSTINDKIQKIFYKMTLIDIIGFNNEQFSSQKILRNIQEFFKDDWKLSLNLNCLCYIVKLDHRANSKTMEKNLELLNFIEKCNVIIVFSCYDLLIPKKDCDKITNEYKEKFHKLGFKKENMILWINIDPENYEQKEKLEKNVQYSLTFNNQENNLIEMIKKIQPIPLDLLKEYRLKLGEFYEKIVPKLLSNSKSLSKAEKSFKEAKIEKINCEITWNLYISSNIKDVTAFEISGSAVAGTIISGSATTGLYAIIANSVAVNIFKKGIKVGTAYVIGGTRVNKGKSIIGGLTIGTATGSILAKAGITLGVGISIYAIYKAVSSFKILKKQKQENEFKKTEFFKDLKNMGKNEGSDLLQNAIHKFILKNINVERMFEEDIKKNNASLGIRKEYIDQLKNNLNIELSLKSVENNSDIFKHIIQKNLIEVEMIKPPRENVTCPIRILFSLEISMNEDFEEQIEQVYNKEKKNIWNKLIEK